MRAKKNVLVTGSNGQLGSELREIAAQYTEYRFFFTDINELNVCDEIAVTAYVQEHAIGIVINCAAYTAVDKAESDVLLCEQLNAVAPGIMAKIMGNKGGLMVHISTDYVFNGKSAYPYTEEAISAPASVYGRTKAAGEIYVQTNCEKFIIIRTSWLYSSFGNNFVKTMLRTAQIDREIGVVYDQIGTPTYAADLAGAIMEILQKPIVSGIYHYSNEGVASWYDFAKAIYRLSRGVPNRIRPLLTSEYATKAPRPPYTVLNKTKIKNTYELTIPYWEDSLAKCLSLLLPPEETKKSAKKPTPARSRTKNSKK